MVKGRRYSEVQRKAFVAAALKTRRLGGSWAEALQAARQLGFLGQKEYLQVLVDRSKTYVYRVPAPTIPKVLQTKWKAEYQLLRCGGGKP